MCVRHEAKDEVVAHCASVLRHPEAGVEESQMSRAELTLALFNACDCDGDGLLNETELKPIAMYTGFCGSAEAHVSSAQAD